MICDIVIPVFNQKKFTQDCIESIKKCTHAPYRIILIDDNSTDLETRKYLTDIQGANIYLIRNESNLGWTKSVNRGLAESSSEYVCVMNNDTIVTDGWLGEMVAVAEKEKDIGLVNPEWEKSDRVSIQDYAKKIERFKGEFIETDWMRGFCFLVKREVLDSLQGLDEAYALGYFDDRDFSVRAIKKGFRCVRARAAYVYHHRNVTHKDVLKQEALNSLMEKNKKIFYERWGRPLRIVFGFDKRILNNGRIEDMLFSLAREQHHIYIWAINKNMPNITHTNVRLVFIPRFLFNLFTLFNIINNLGRNITKKYDAIYIDDRNLFRLLSIFGLDKKIRISLCDFNDSNLSIAINEEIKSIKK